MIICDRCKKNEAKYRGYYIAGKGRDLCAECERSYSKLENVIFAIEKQFMNNEDVRIYKEGSIKNEHNRTNRTLL